VLGAEWKYPDHSGSRMGAMKETARPGLRRGLWVEILALALVYYGVGRLAWLLVPVPGHAVALWPPAGLALGVLLWRGLAVWPGALLGAGALALQAILMSRSLPLPRACVVAFGVGLGSTLEPVLAALAVRRFVQIPPRNAREAATFAALAGPAPAAIGALISNGVLFWGGQLTRQALALSIGVWWVGDALGAMVFAPLVRVIASRAQVPRRSTVVVPVLVATALAVWVFVRASAWDDRRAQAVLRQRTDAITAAVQRGLTYHLDALRALADFVGNDSKVDPAAFQRVATGAVVRHFAYEALAWAPAPLDRPPVQVALVEPGTEHLALKVGQDLAASPAQAEKLSASRHNGEAFTLPSPDDGKRLWVFVPAPGRNGEQGIQGFFGASLRLDTMIDRAVAEFGREGVAVELLEAGSKRRSLFRMPSNAGAGPFRSLENGEKVLVIADRSFVLAPVVSQAALNTQRSAEVWVVLLAGMLFVALLEGVLLVAATRPREAAQDNFDITWPEAHLGRRS
jgi:integral membrane sensor domain MASE1